MFHMDLSSSVPHTSCFKGIYEENSYFNTKPNLPNMAMLLQSKMSVQVLKTNVVSVK